MKKRSRSGTHATKSSRTSPTRILQTDWCQSGTMTGSEKRVAAEWVGDKNEIAGDYHWATNQSNRLATTTSGHPTYPFRPPLFHVTDVPFAKDHILGGSHQIVSICLACKNRKAVEVTWLASFSIKRSLEQSPVHQSGARSWPHRQTQEGPRDRGRRWKRRERHRATGVPPIPPGHIWAVGLACYFHQVGTQKERSRRRNAISSVPNAVDGQTKLHVTHKGIPGGGVVAVDAVAHVLNLCTRVRPMMMVMVSQLHTDVDRAYHTTTTGIGDAYHPRFRRSRLQFRGQASHP